MSTNVRVINFTGDVTLPTVGTLAGTAQQALQEVPMVLVSLSQASDIDLAGIQMIIALKRYARAEGKSVHLTGAVPDTVAARFVAGGFIPAPVRDGREMDQHLEGQEQVHA